MTHHIRGLYNHPEIGFHFFDKKLNTPVVLNVAHPINQLFSRIYCMYLIIIYHNIFRPIELMCTRLRCTKARFNNYNVVAFMVARSLSSNIKTIVKKLLFISKCSKYNGFVCGGANISRGNNLLVSSSLILLCVTS